MYVARFNGITAWLEDAKSTHVEIGLSRVAMALPGGFPSCIARGILDESMVPGYHRRSIA